MDLGAPKNAPPRERILPMINVAFLLLIMVVMLAEFTASAPFDVTPPTAAGDTRASRDIVVFVAADGTMSFRGVTGEEVVFNALGAFCVDGRCPNGGILSIKADESLSAVAFAQILGRLQSLGFAQVEIVTVLP